MDKAKNYKDLLVWQKAVDLAEAIYKITQCFPKDELYGLSSQLRRCSVSIASNIAEGQARASLPQFVHFLNLAKGSMAEMDTQLIIATRLGYISSFENEELVKQQVEVTKLLHGLLKALQNQT